MTRFWRQLIVQTVLKGKKGQTPENKEFSKLQLAKGFRLLRIELIRLIKDIFLIALGIASAAFGLESFLLPNKFIDGGATGIALLTSEVTDVSISVLLVLINIPFILIGYKMDIPKKDYFLFSLAQASFKVTVLLKTSLSSVASLSKQKYPLRKNW